MSITHNKNLNALLNLLINCISTRYAPQILLINVEFPFLFFNFLIIDFCNSSVNSLFEIFSYLISDLFASVAVPPEVFLSKMYGPLKQVHVHIHHILDIWKYQMLYHAIFYQKIIFCLNL